MGWGRVQGVGGGGLGDCLYTSQQLGQKTSPPHPIEKREGQGVSIMPRHILRVQIAFLEF